jgi:hypothetical protein
MPIEKGTLTISSAGRRYGAHFTLVNGIHLNHFAIVLTVYHSLDIPRQSVVQVSYPQSILNRKDSVIYTISKNYNMDNC